MNRKVKVGVVVLPPLTQKKGNKFEGFEIDLWEFIACKLNIDFEYEELIFEKGLRKLKNKKIDVLISSLTITSERESTIDFSYPTLKSGLSILVSKDFINTDFVITFKNFVKFNFKKILNLGLISLFLILVSSNLLWFFERGFSVNQSYYPGILQSVWVSFTTLIGLLTGGSSTLIFEAVTWQGKGIKVAIHLLGLCIIALLIAEISSFVSSRRRFPLISDPNDLFAKTIATVSGSTSEILVKKYHPLLLTTSTFEDAIRKLKNHKVEAVVLDSPILLDYTNSDSGKWSKVVGEIFEVQTYGFGFVQKSTLRDPVNRVILDLKESGQYNIIYNKWFGDDRNIYE